MANEAILIQNLTKKYDAHPPMLALNNLQLTVPQGTIFGLLGPNGAGKSTLINILAGTVTMTGGSVSIMGVDIVTLPKKASSMIGIVPQEIVFDTFFSIEQSLEFTAGYYGIAKRDRKTESILKSLSLWDKRHNVPRQLSGGMQRRFLIAKALVHSPKVLILDEPTAGVDLELRNQLWQYIFKLKSEGMTIIITTHYLAEAQELCDEIAFIYEGEIIKQDTKKCLLCTLGSRYMDVIWEQSLPSSLMKSFSQFEYQMISENTVRFYLNFVDNDYTNLLKQLSGSNLSIKDLKISEPNLEDIFYKIIREHG